MNYKTLTYCMLFAFGTMLTSCSTTEEAESPTQAWRWILKADRESLKSATLVRGMTKDQVRHVLGRPYRIAKKKKDTPLTEKWIYKRRVNGQMKMLRVKTNNGYTSVVHPEIYLETITIEFFDLGITEVKIVRRVERITSNSATEF